MTTVECPCQCGFEVELTEGGREQMEQHVRWIHLPGREFGPQPIYALTSMMINGLIHPDEFRGLAEEILNPPVSRWRRWRAFWLVWATPFVLAAGELTYGWTNPAGDGVLRTAAYLLFLAAWVLSLLAAARTRVELGGRVEVRGEPGPGLADPETQDDEL